MDLSFCLKINNGYAMKKILKIEENKIDDMEIKNEIDIFQKLDHPNIVILLSLNFINMENHVV
jgi:serine/threonine protein kinase